MGRFSLTDFDLDRTVSAAIALLLTHRHRI
jgi:hypothetical protein